MSDSNSRLPGGGVRRVGRKDRKRRLDPVGPLFPQEDETPAPPAAVEVPAETTAGELAAPSTPAVSPVPEASDVDDLIDEDDVAEDFEEALDDLMDEDEEDDNGEAAAPFAPLSAPPPPAPPPAPRRPEPRPVLPSAPPPAGRIIVTPPEERFPPVAPDAPAPSSAPDKPASLPRAAKRRRRRLRGNWRHDVLAALFLLATIGVGAFYLWIWQNPYNPANPFALPTPFIEVTATPNPEVVRQMVATERAQNLAAALESAQSAITPEVTPESAEATDSPQATPTPIQIGSVLPFALDETGIQYRANENGLGCNWGSIAGAVTGLDGLPLDGYGIQINDVENPGGVRDRVYSGAAQTFGAGGFELPLGGAPVEGQFSVQLFSPAGVPLSDVFTVITSGTCEQNVLVVNFVQVRAF
ncbi:MAG: hypothetical protein SF029_16455 [bacterium]|nr:hypothetical protein [bacterium]